ncbi:MAG: hypothetical protein M9953_14270, partial [Thermomicrobiales bacterium]|nr:hypothetical protein [Thermomicrobiales bacterium]
MAGVRVLVGTAKGAFILTSDEARAEWDISGPHFPGAEVYHAKGSMVNPDLLFVAQANDWFGQLVHRSTDGGTTWEQVGNTLNYDGETGTHQWYDGTPHPWEFRRIWHIEPSIHDENVIYAGVEDA